MFAVSLAGIYVKAEKEFEASAAINNLGVPPFNVSTLDASFDQDDDGYGFVISAAFKPVDNLSLAARLESEVDLDLKVDHTTGQLLGKTLLDRFDKKDGVSYARDLPGVLAVGAQWKATPKLTITPTFTLYLEKDADWGDKNGTVDHNSYDAGIAFEYAFTEKFTGSIGYLRTDIGIKPEDFSLTNQLNPALDAHSVGLGGTYKHNEKWTFTGALSGSFYEADSAPANPARFSPAVEYDKTNYTLAVGIQYKPL